MSGDVTVVIPTIPPRAAVLQRAVASVIAQYTMPAAIHVVSDRFGDGAPVTRHRGLMNVETEWVAFLDDDDEFLPYHLGLLLEAADTHDADYVWSRFKIAYPNGHLVDGPAPLAERSFMQWDDDHPAQTTITTMVRTKLAQSVGGFLLYEDDGRTIDGQRRGEDFDFTMRCRAAGAVFRHVPEVTWTWHHWGHNTSGLASRWMTK